MPKLSPMMAHYLNIKEEYKEEIVFFRLGDFYEMFFDDAIKASELLGLTLTGRDCGLEERAPMCGVPYHAADSYIAKLIALGEKVAVCEQLSDPRDGKGMVERGVVRVITSGTVIDDESLDKQRSNYLAAVVMHDGVFGIAYADISTGELVAGEYADEDNILETALISIQPSEIIADVNAIERVNALGGVAQQRLPRPRFYHNERLNVKEAERIVLKQLNIPNLSVYECADKPALVIAVAALLNYAGKTQMRELKQLNSLKIVKNEDYLIIDANTRRNLELVQNARDGKCVGSLLWVMDCTRTAMGARLLRDWIDRPLRDEGEINARLDAVGELNDNNYLRANLSDQLKLIRDIERLSCKIPNNNCSPRDIAALSNTLMRLPEIKELLANAKCAMLSVCNSEIDLNEELAKLLADAVEDNPPAIAREGGFIRDGFNDELDRVRGIKANAASVIADIERRERERTGIKALRIRFNRVHGYYIELPRSQAENAPFNYVRRQTTANSERYITEELNAVEEEILSADERTISLELQIFERLKEAVLTRLRSLQVTAAAIARLDVLLAFSDIARAGNYTRPAIKKTNAAIVIEGGRHPVVEKNIGRNYYTANDTYLDNADNRTMIITGPNMSGKSTYMRQVAIIALMAHIGSFVPASKAILPIMDRIFTRIGASDDLMSGQSTFMVEMVEVATILKNCTDNSLLILDEIGRGTSTCDGLSIAWAVIEHISAHYKCKTLFSTHYHELTALENNLDGIRNYRVSVSEINGQIVFTHRIAKGEADRSFGVEVAELAGIPKEVIERARQLNGILEKNNAGLDVNAILLGSKNTAKIAKPKQQSFLSDIVESELTARLKTLKTDNMTPMQALIELDNLKSMLK